MKKKLLLFDIDGTLLLGNKETHANVMKKAFREVIGRSIGVLVEEMSGKTDRQTIEESMSNAGFSALEINESVGMIFQHMISIYKETDLGDFQLLPGVKELLRELATRRDILIGLLTGNLEEIAYMKLGRFELGGFFVFREFGDKHGDRAALVRDALKRAKKRFAIENALIIGDTFWDIKAARANGIKVLAVATGWVDIEALRKFEPDYLFSNFEDTDSVLKVLANS